MLFLESNEPDRNGVVVNIIVAFFSSLHTLSVRRQIGWRFGQRFANRFSRGFRTTDFTTVFKHLGR